MLKRTTCIVCSEFFMESSKVFKEELNKYKKDYFTLAPFNSYSKIIEPKSHNSYSINILYFEI